MRQDSRAPGRLARAGWPAAAAPPRQPNSRRSVRRWLLAWRWAPLVLAALCLAGGPPRALFGQEAPGARANGQLRVLHLAAEPRPLAVAIDGAPVLAALGAGRSSEYLVLPAGEHRVSVALAGDDADAPPLAALALPVGIGAFHTLLVLPAPAAPLALTDESLAASGGPARVRLVHAAADAGTLVLEAAGGQRLVEAPAFGAASDYGDAPPGTRALLVRAVDGGAVLASIPDATLAADYAYTFVVVARAAPANTWEIVPLVDAEPPLRSVGGAPQ